MEAITNFFEATNEALARLFAAISASFTSMCETYAFPVLNVFFEPINTLLGKIYQPYATITAIAFFVGTMIWVGFVLRESYVNLGRPKRVWYTDLRIWTAVSMLPHVFVYFYFY